MLLTSYTEWKHCIEVKCSIKLTEVFIKERINELQNGTHPKTMEFIQLYGINYRDKILGWFKEAGSLIKS